MKKHHQGRDGGRRSPGAGNRRTDLKSFLPSPGLRIEGLPDLLTAAEAAAWLRLSVQRPVAALRRAGVPLCRLAGHVRIRRADLEGYLKDAFPRT